MTRAAWCPRLWDAPRLVQSDGVLCAVSVCCVRVLCAVHVCLWDARNPMLCPIHGSFFFFSLLLSFFFLLSSSFLIHLLHNFCSVAVTRLGVIKFGACPVTKWGLQGRVMTLTVLTVLCLCCACAVPVLCLGPHPYLRDSSFRASPHNPMAGMPYCGVPEVMEGRRKYNDFAIILTTSSGAFRNSVPPHKRRTTPHTPPTPHTPCGMDSRLIGAHAYRMLIGACVPMS